MSDLVFDPNVLMSIVALVGVLITALYARASASRGPAVVRMNALEARVDSLQAGIADAEKRVIDCERRELECEAKHTALAASMAAMELRFNRLNERVIEQDER